ncbi:MAG: cobyrinate a,c-diamide synthase [Nitrospirae bacterium]|nr:cobyrinate a,c-diamide synthase [Nitrospirota bacterium]
MRYNFLIAATHSGAGKTTVSLGLMAALKKRGLTVQPFKCGPDFIDTGLHGLVCGKSSHNLDLYMCGRDYVTDLFNRKVQSADISIVEGVMGLFDGGESSSAALAKALDIPIILIIDAKSMAQSAGAVLYGFLNYDKDVNIAGVIINNIGSPRHQKMVEEGLVGLSSIPILGFLPKNPDIVIPNRHLGLYTAYDNPIDDILLSRLIEHIEGNIDIDRLVGAYCICPMGQVLHAPTLPIIKIAVAMDKAFCFYYEENLQLLRNNGAEIVLFSPINDSVLPEGIDAVYLGGGYPELYGEQLSSNHTMINSIKGFAESGGVIYAECGGFVYLTQGIYDVDGGFSPLAGIFPVKARMKKGRAYLGYREVVLKRDTIIGKKGDILRGHEFHYSEIEAMPKEIERVYNISEGFMIKNCLGSYVHIHFGSNLNIAQRFVSY